MWDNIKLGDIESVRNKYNNANFQSTGNDRKISKKRIEKFG